MDFLGEDISRTVSMLTRERKMAEAFKEAARKRSQTPEERLDELLHQKMELIDGHLVPVD